MALYSLIVLTHSLTLKLYHNMTRQMDRQQEAVNYYKSRAVSFGHFCVQRYNESTHNTPRYSEGSLRRCQTQTEWCHHGWAVLESHQVPVHRTKPRRSTITDKPCKYHAVSLHQ